MSTRPLSVRLNLIFIFLNFLVWLVLGVIIAANLQPSLPAQRLLKGIMAAMSFTSAVILLAALILLVKRKHSDYFIVLGFLIVTALLGTNLIPIVLLIKDHAWYLQEETLATGER